MLGVLSKETAAVTPVLVALYDRAFLAESWRAAWRERRSLYLGLAASWFEGAPWEHQDDFKARSPITYIKEIKTPLMLIEGDADLRTPPTAGGEQMFRALKYLKIPTVMVRFPRETHELSRSGEPMHRVERLQHIVGWMDKWLQGKQTSTYE